MKKSLLPFMFLFSVGAIAQTAVLPVYDCVNNGTQALTSGLKSTNYQLGVVPYCVVTIYLTGTQTVATTSPQTPLTANSNGSIPPIYAAVNQGYDVVLSGGIYPNTYASPVTLTGLYPGTNITPPCSLVAGAYPVNCGGTGATTAAGALASLGAAALTGATFTGPISAPSATFTGVGAAGGTIITGTAPDADQADIVSGSILHTPLATGEPSGNHWAHNVDQYYTLPYAISNCTFASDNLACDATSPIQPGWTMEVAGMTTCSFLNFTITSPTTQLFTIITNSGTHFTASSNITHADTTCTGDTGYIQGVWAYAMIDDSHTCGNAGDKVPGNHCYFAEQRYMNISPQRLPTAKGISSQFINNGGIVASNYNIDVLDDAGTNVAGIQSSIGHHCGVFTSSKVCIFDESLSNDYISGGLYLGKPVNTWINYPLTGYPSNGAGIVISTGQHQGTSFVSTGNPAVTPVTLNAYSAAYYNGGLNCQVGTGSSTAPSVCTIQNNGGPTIIGGFLTISPTAIVPSTPSPSNGIYWNWWNGTIELSASINADSTGNLALNPYSGKSVLAPSFTLNGGTAWTSSSSANSQVVTCAPESSTPSTDYCGANGSWQAPSTGTVTSVALKSASPNLFSGTAGTAVTSSGTLDPDAQLKTQSANCIVGGPSSGSAAAPTCRSSVTADLPSAQTTRTVTVTDVAPVTGDDLLIVVLDPATAVQLTRFSCGVTGTTSVITNLVSGGNSLIADMTATAGTVNQVVVTTWVSGSCSSQTTYCPVAAHTPVTLHIGTISGTPTSVSCALDYTVN
jgi:hypothetical protein